MIEAECSETRGTTADMLVVGILRIDITSCSKVNVLLNMKKSEAEWWMIGLASHNLWAVLTPFRAKLIPPAGLMQLRTNAVLQPRSPDPCADDEAGETSPSVHCYCMLDSDTLDLISFGTSKLVASSAPA